MHRLALLALMFAPALAAQISVPELTLDDRIELTVNRLVDLDARPAFTTDFILADVAIDLDDPRRFYNFSGDLSGRYLEVMSLLDEAQRGRVDLDKLVARIIAEQRPDGRFGDERLSFTAEEIGGEHMALLWGNGRLLVGLMTYYEATRDRLALEAAIRLGDFFIGTAEQSREPAIAERLEGFGAKGIICFTQYIEGLVMLARATAEDRFVTAARDAYTVLPQRDQVHTHGYLTTLRGVLMLHELTGEAELLTYTLRTFNELLDSDDYTHHGAVYEYFGGKGNRDEGCSSADFVRLAFHLAQLTGEERYRSVAERATFNALLYNQYPSGDYGNHQFVEKGMSTRTPQKAWWCCTMHGLRALLALRQDYLLAEQGNATSLRLLITHEKTEGDKRYRLTYTGVEEGHHRYQLQIEAWDGTDLTIATPTDSRLARRVYSPVAGQTLDIEVDYEIHFYDRQGKRTGGLPDEATDGYITLGPYLMGVTQDDYLAEPSWKNQIDWRTLRPSDGTPLLLTATYRHGGYPGLQSVDLHPVHYQTYLGHPYLALVTRYTSRIKPEPTDN